MIVHHMIWWSFANTLMENASRSIIEGPLKEAFQFTYFWSEGRAQRSFGTRLMSKHPYRCLTQFKAEAKKLRDEYLVRIFPSSSHEDDQSQEVKQFTFPIGKKAESQAREHYQMVGVDGSLPKTIYGEFADCDLSMLF